MRQPLPQSLLTTKEVADRLGLQPGTLENWRRIGRGPLFVKLGAKLVRYRPEDVDAWVAETTARDGGGS